MTQTKIVAPLLALLASPLAARQDALNNLLDLRGEVCPVRYSPGSLDRASHVQERLDTLVLDFRRWGQQAYRFQAYVLGPEDWAAGKLHRPYGLPERSGFSSLAVPAWGEEHSVALWKRLLGGELPWGGDLPLRGTPEEAASLGLSDIVLQLEVAHVFVASEGLQGEEPWIGDVVAHVVALQAFASHEAVRLGEVTGFWNTLAARGKPSLADCASRPATVEAELACQGFYYEAARRIFDDGGMGSLGKLKKLARKKGLSQASLTAAHPSLAGWFAGTNPPR